MAKLECNTCGEHLETTDQASLDAFREQHAHVFEDRDEFGMIFEKGGIESNVAQLPLPAVKTANPSVVGVNAGYKHQRDKFERHLILDSVFRFQDNVTILEFHNFVEATLKAFDDAHTNSGVGPYD